MATWQKHSDWHYERWLYGNLSAEITVKEERTWSEDEGWVQDRAQAVYWSIDDAVYGHDGALLDWDNIDAGTAKSITHAKHYIDTVWVSHVIHEEVDIIEKLVNV